MKKNDLLKYKEKIVRILDLRGSEVLLIEINNLKMPFWTKIEEIACYQSISELEMLSATGVVFIDNAAISEKSKNIMWQRMNLIAPIIPLAGDIRKRAAEIRHISENSQVSDQSIRHYLMLYLAYMDIRILAPKERVTKKELSEAEKNFRWALNKYFYNRNKNTLKLTYEFMLKERYTDEQGVLLLEYPTFAQFRYFYRKTKNTMNTIISREGKSKYERDYRPLITEGVTEYATCPGVFMLDGTVLDIYLINDTGEVIGRPILTAAIDAYSGLCCGYHLSLEGGSYSLMGLMVNVVADKVEHCKKFGISITEDMWPCHYLPYEFTTDRGKEYTSDNDFGHITELGCTISNLPPYAAEKKGPVEQFFDSIQELFRPHLQGYGVIRDDFQERGATDYRKQSSLTLRQFETILLRCIVYYNSNNLKEYFPYTKDMLDTKVKPTASSIWKYGLDKLGILLREVDKELLVKTLLPRTEGTFTRKGLKVGKLYYFNPGYTEQYLTGGKTLVAYNPDNVNVVWAIDKNRNFIEFSLIQKRYQGMSYDLVELQKKQQSDLIRENKEEELQASLNLIEHIQTIAKQGNGAKKEIKSIRENRTKEKKRKHRNFLYE